MIRAAFLALALASAALAPNPLMADDPRLVELEYDPGQIVRINGK